MSFGNQSWLYLLLMAITSTLSAVECEKNISEVLGNVVLKEIAQVSDLGLEPGLVSSDVAVFRHPVTAAVVVPILVKAVLEFILYQIEDEDRGRAEKIRAEIEKQTALYEQQQKEAKGCGQTRGLPEGLFGEVREDAPPSGKLYSAAEVTRILEAFLEHLLVPVAFKKRVVSNFFNNYQMRMVEQSPEVGLTGEEVEQLMGGPSGADTAC